MNSRRTQFELKQTSASHEPPHSKSLVTQDDDEKIAPKTALTAIQSINKGGRHVENLCNSAASKPSLKRSSVEKSSRRIAR